MSIPQVFSKEAVAEASKDLKAPYQDFVHSHEPYRSLLKANPWLALPKSRESLTWGEGVVSTQNEFNDQLARYINMAEAAKRICLSNHGLSAVRVVSCEPFCRRLQARQQNPKRVQSAHYRFGDIIRRCVGRLILTRVAETVGANQTPNGEDVFEA